MAKFNAEFYRLFRPLYPAELFLGLEARLQARGFPVPFDGVDLGCGTGHSSASLLQSGLSVKISAIDPDLEMLKQARYFTKSLALSGIEFLQGLGEATGLQSQCCDLVLVGSAFHWMHPEKTRDEITRILRPGGLLLVFEYQFPKTPQSPELNEWIRRQFNLYWKAPNQVPRGTFTQLTQVFRTDPRFEVISETRPKMIQTLSVEELAGLIFSQSRVLHYENTLTEAEKEEFRTQTRQKLQEFYDQQSSQKLPALQFDFNLRAILLGLKNELALTARHTS